MGCELSNTAVGSQKLNEGSHSNSSTEDCSTSRNTTESENNNCTATHLERTKVDPINGNPIPSSNNDQAMPDITRTQDLNCGINTDRALDLNSTEMANIEESDANHSDLKQQHHAVSSSSPTTSSPPPTSVSSAATTESVPASDDAATQPSHQTSVSDTDENGDAANMNTSRTHVQESDDLVSQNAPVVNSSAENTAATDDILCGSETRTILKEDGLKDIMITVPVLQRLPTTPGSKVSNGHRPLKSDNQQMRKRPVLVRKATPIKIETHHSKVISETTMQMSRENSFAEEEEEDSEEEGEQAAAAMGVST